jgi:hypothetical protein
VKASPHHDLLKEQPALNAKPCPIGLILSPAPQPHKGNSTGLPDLPPNSHTSGLHDLHWNHAPKACQAGNPQIFMISGRLHPLGLHQILVHPISALLGHAPKACQAGNPQALHDLHSASHPPQACTGPHDLHSARAMPKACTGLHDLRSAGRAPKACQASDPQTFTISAGQCPSHPHSPA